MDNIYETNDTAKLLNDVRTIVSTISPNTDEIKLTHRLEEIVNNYILLKSKYPFLNEYSCVKFEDIKTVDKVRIGEHLGNIDVKDLDLMRNRLLFAMGF